MPPLLAVGMCTGDAMINITQQPIREKGKPKPRIKARDDLQPEYMAWLKRLFPTMERHHLIHNKRSDRRRKDDRLVWPLSPHWHRVFHDKDGNEARFFRESLSIPDIYICGEWLWQIWVQHGYDGEHLAIAYVNEVYHGVTNY